MFPIELLRALLALIGIGAAFMAGRAMAAVRKGIVKPGRQYAWIVRALICFAALSFRHIPDLLLIAASLLAIAAFAAGWHQVSHAKPPEDLSHDIVPRQD